MRKEEIMNKEELKYYLIGRQKEPKFYADNEERKKIFLELLGEKYPYAIKVFVEAPARFIEDWGTYKDKNFKLIVPLYSANQTETQMKDYYCKTFANLNDKNSVLSCLETEFWSNSTLELMNFYKRLHKKIKDDKALKNDIREFHGACFNKISEMAKGLEEIKKKATVYFDAKESRYIKESLFSDICTEENKNTTVRLLKKHAKNVFTVEYFKEVSLKYKSIDWINVYIQSMIDNFKEFDYQQLVIEFFNSLIMGKVDDSLIIEVIKKLPESSISNVFNNINKLEVFDKMFEYFTATYNRPNDVITYSKLYLDKFSDSGEAICNVATHVLNGRSSVNSLPEIIEQSVKGWLLNYNFHNKENEICNVIEALSTVEKLEELFYDFSFWKKMERCNAFISLIDSISYIVGFDDCYDLIEKNYFAAKAYGEAALADKWMQAASSIAVHYEDAQRPYVLLIGNMVGEDSSLDSRSKEILLKKVVYDVLSQASSNKKRLDLEIQKSKEMKDECVQDMIFHLYEPLQKLEKTIIGYSDVGMGTDDETMMVLRNMVAKVRQALKHAGVLPIIDIDVWEKRKVIPFDGNLHICMEELKKGDPVTCLSMGMRDEKEGFFEKAAVKVHVGDKK